MTVLNVRIFRKEVDAREFARWISKQLGVRSVRQHATEDRAIPKRWIVKWTEEPAVPSTT